MTFAEQLKSERKRLGLTQAGAAALLSDEVKTLSARTYWKWESGADAPLEITQEGALARLRKHKVGKGEKPCAGD